MNFNNLFRMEGLFSEISGDLMMRDQMFIESVMKLSSHA